MCTRSSGRETLQTGVGLLRSRDGWAGLGVASQERDVQGCSHAAGQGGGHGVPNFLDSFPSDLRGLEGAQHAFQHTSDM